jgi:hypothetical protein
MNFFEKDQVDSEQFQINNLEIDNFVFKWKPASAIIK